MSKSIIVGYDGSAASDLALNVGLDLAASRGESLLILVTWDSTSLSLGEGMVTGSGAALTEGLRVDGQLALDRAVAMARARADGVHVSGEVIAGPAARTLVIRSADASLVVVGTHGKHGLSGLLLGSVSREVATHAKCPVIVARDPADTTSKRVVVGIDGSSGSTAALQFAFDHASRTGGDVLVVHAWEVPSLMSTGSTPLFTFNEILLDFEGAETRSAAEALAGYAERFPDVRVRTEIVHGLAKKALVEASEHAALTVVGSRGRGGFVGLLLGSVSHSISHSAKSSVAVVR